jgi:hypothetical protein
LGFFGFARYADINNLFEKRRHVRPSSPTAEVGKPVVRRAILRGFIAGVIGRIVEMRLWDLTDVGFQFQDDSYKVLDKLHLIGDSAVCVLLGWIVRNSVAAAISGLVVGVIISVVVNLVEGSELSGDLAYVLIVWMTVAAKDALIGVTDSLLGAVGKVVLGAVIGGIGGFISGGALLMGMLVLSLPSADDVAVCLLYNPLFGCIHGGIVGGILQTGSR